VPRAGMPITLLVAVPLSQRAAAMTEQPTIIIVDDDPEIREALGSLIRSVGVQAKALASVPEFLNEGRPGGPTCLVLDVRLPGRLNKQIAHDIGISEITVKVHRGQVMRKMKAASLPDLARMADKLKFKAEKSPNC